jgi:NAD(P)H-dependent FMN reductase
MAELAPSEITFRMVDGIDRLPYFNPDIDDIENPPETVTQFRKALREADALILCSPEYAHNISGLLKNALDWVVGSGELVNKPVVVVNVSTSFMGGGKVSTCNARHKATRTAVLSGVTICFSCIYFYLFSTV